MLRLQYISGEDPGFQVRGGGEGAKCFGVFRVKNHVLRQKIIFFPILYIASNNTSGINIIAYTDTVIND